MTGIPNYNFTQRKKVNGILLVTGTTEAEIGEDWACVFVTSFDLLDMHVTLTARHFGLVAAWLEGLNPGEL